MAVKTLPHAGDEHLSQADLYRGDRMNNLATKLEALLAATYGEQGKTFRRLNDDLQDAYLWACSDMATELKELTHEAALSPDPKC